MNDHPTSTSIGNLTVNVGSAHQDLHCSIDGLPNELLLEILAHLLPIRGFSWSPEPENERRKENVTRIRTLYSLALTCRRLHALATPILYQSFVHPSAACSRPLLFLNTIADRPDLLRYIQYIEVQFAHGPLLGPYDDYLGLLCAVLQKLPAGAATVVSHTGADKYGGSLITLLALAENAVEIALDRMCGCLASLVEGPKTLPLLRRAWLMHPMSCLGAADITIASVPTKMRNPVLNLMHVLNTDIAPVPTDSLLPGIGERIDELILDNCNMKAAQISTLLGDCCSLKRFTCRWRTRQPFQTAAGPSTSIDLQRLGTDLAKFHDSLEQLVLDTLESGWQVSLEEDIPTIGSLRAFTALKHLDVSGLVLWSDDDTIEHSPLASILPESLETLVINVEWDDYVGESLIALSQDAPSLFPKLRSIECSWRPAPSHVVDMMMELFKDAGIRLGLNPG